MQPDSFFNAAQVQRLTELMDRWRAARDAGQPFPEQEQAELNALIETELQAAIKRSAALARRLEE